MSSVVSAAMDGFGVALGLALLTWIASLLRRDVSLVDRAWAIMIWAPGVAYAFALSTALGPRVVVMLVLAAVWAIRLAIYVTWRNWGHGEDRRYQAIRARNQPNFPIKSIYLIFVLQAVLAWLVSMPFLVAAAEPTPRAWTWLDIVFGALVVFGIVFEAVADQQLASFKAKPANKGRVMDRGLWRYSRHPNYFGEFCVWWGLFGMSLATGMWWGVVSPIVMSVLLLKVSGVGLLEKDIGERRPAYRDYIRRTHAFFPLPPKPAR